MCGYTSYNDPRLRAPEYPEEESDIDAWVRCRFGGACKGICEVMAGGMDAETAARKMGCATCEHWEEMSSTPRLKPGA